MCQVYNPGIFSQVTLGLMERHFTYIAKVFATEIYSRPFGLLGISFLAVLFVRRASVVTHTGIAAGVHFPNRVLSVEERR